MTAQAADTIRYKGKLYYITARTKRIPFNPLRYGIEPHERSTACHNGFWCAYQILDNQFFLQNLYIHNNDDNYPDLNGVKVSPPEYYESQQNGKLVRQYKDMGHHIYKDVNLFIPYAGKILGGAGFLHEYNIHGGYRRPYAYDEVIEFTFADGILQDVQDCSRDAEDTRSHMDSEKVNWDPHLFHPAYGKNGTEPPTYRPTQWWMNT